MTAAVAFAAAFCLLPRPDADGIPVPAGAVRRLGSARFQTGFYASGLAASPDGGTVVSCGYGGWATAFETATGRPRWAIRIGKGMLSNAAFTADGKHVYLAEAPGYGNGGATLLTIHRRDAATGAAVDSQTLGGRNGGYNSAFDAAGTVAVTAAAGQQLVVQDLAAKKAIKTYSVAQNNWPGSMAASTGGKTVAALLGQKMYIYDVAGGKDALEVPEGGDQTGAVAVSPDGATVASIGLVSQKGGPKQFQVLRLYDKAGKKLAEHTADEDLGAAFYGSVVAFAPDGKRVAVGGYTRDVKLYDAATAKPVCVLAGAIGTPLTFSGDGKTVFAGSGGIQLWDAATGKPRPVSADMPASDYLGRVEFGPGTVTLCGAMGDDRVTWDWQTGKELGRVPGAEAAAKGFGDAVVTYRSSEAIATRSRDGKRLARRTAHGEKIGLEILDAATGAVTTTIEGLTVRELAFTADGKRLIVGAGDHAAGVATVYDAATGKKLQTLKSGESTQSNIYLSQQSISPAPVGDLVAMTESHAFSNGGVNENNIRFQMGVYDAATGRRVAGVAGGGMLNTYTWSDDATRLVLSGALGFDGNEPDGFFGSIDPATGKWVLPHTRNKGGGGRPGLSPDGKLLAVGTDAGLQFWETASGKLRATVPGPRLRNCASVFVPDGRHVLAFGAGHAVLVYDTAAVRAAGPTADPAADWAALADPDAAKAYAAMCRLAAGGDAAVMEVRKHLTPVAPPDPGRLKQLLMMLDSPKFADRELAVKELRALGELAAPDVRRALETTTSAEVRDRAGRLLQYAPKPTPDGLRAGRAVELLLWMQSPATKTLLAELANGAEGAALTRDARRAGR